MKEIEIMKLTDTATLPTRTYKTDSGLDIYAAETITMKPQEKRLLSTGIAVDIPAGYVGLLTSRSGVSSKTNLVIETGKIDAGFNGEMKINIKNDESKPEKQVRWNNAVLDRPFEPLIYDVKGKKIENGNPYELIDGKDYLIQKGDKIAQLVVVPIVTPEIKIVDDFQTGSERGSNGFGSTDEVSPEYSAWFNRGRY